MFKSTEVTHKIGLIGKLINVKLENCDSMADYVSQITTVVILSEIGLQIDNELTGAIMLAGIEELKPMIMGFKGSGITTNADAVKSKLLDSSYSTRQATAFIGKNATKINANPKVKNTNKKNSFKNKDGAVIKCFVCGKVGHIAKNCRKNKVKFDKFKKSNKSENLSSEKEG